MKLNLVIPIIFLVSLVTFQNILFSENIKHKQNDTLVTWSKGIITTEEFEDFALYAVFHNDSSIAQNSKMSLRRRIINDLLNFKIIKHLADSLHVDTLETMRNSYQRKLYKTAYKYLYRDSVIQKIVSNENVNKFNSSMKLEYNVDHILLTVNENNKTNIKKKINSIYSNLIKDPESFNTIAVQNSDDDFSRINGGNLGWSVISNYVPEFSEQISNLEIGEISKPFKTQFGWHIAKLKNIRKNPDLGSFKKEKGNITNQIIKMHKQEFDKTRNKFRSFLYKKYQVYIDTINVMSFVNYFNDLLNEDISSAYDYNNYNT
jgi:parvulin-like peptidyl-prolyl isomerase